MIGLLHGYLLEGSGSNLWTRAVVEALCRAGETVHLVCQEPHPEAYDFVTAAYRYEAGGAVTTLVERATPYPGRCILHKPRLGDTLPVYVGDRYEEFLRAVPMVELPDAEIEAYLARNAAVVERIVREHGVTVLHANHAVLMSVVAERVSRSTGVPYAIMPHGSALEYAVRKDPRFHALARSALAGAARIFVIGGEMRRRIVEIFPDLAGLEAKFAFLQLVVDTAAFVPSTRADSPARIAELDAALGGLARGRAAGAGTELRSRLSADLDRAGLQAALAGVRGYDEKLPDGGLEDRLDAVDWQHDELVLFVGRLIAAKGLQSAIAALPAILEARPRARLVVVGHGPLREVMEAWLWALEQGARGLAERIAAWGSLLEEGPGAGLDTVAGHFAELDRRNALDRYFETAQRVIRPDRVIFTGYLTHAELRHLFPCCDAAVFPSIVPEAGPLVFLEAMAAGCFPLGTYTAGLAERIDTAAAALPGGQGDLMKLSPDPAQTVAEIADKVPRALALGGRRSGPLRRLAIERHDWSAVARRLVLELAASTAEPSAK